jgi:hypothetical protein
MHMEYTKHITQTPCFQTLILLSLLLLVLCRFGSNTITSLLSSSPLFPSSSPHLSFSLLVTLIPQSSPISYSLYFPLLLFSCLYSTFSLPLSVSFSYSFYCSSLYFSILLLLLITKLTTTQIFFLYGFGLLVAPIFGKYGMKV